MNKKKLLITSLVFSLPLSLSAREQLTFKYLTGSEARTFNTQAFIAQALKPSKHQFSGRLKITGQPEFKQLYGEPESLPENATKWPLFDKEFIQYQNALIPVDRAHGFIGGGPWSVTAGVGKVWQEAQDKGLSRAAFPFTLKQFNANCEANGVATFLFDSEGNASKAQVQTLTQTCPFYGFDMFGKMDVVYTPYQLKNSDDVVTRYKKQQQNQFQSKPLAELANDFPNVNLENYGYAIKADDLLGYSVFTGGINYRSGCDTRYGPHPFCSEKTIGVYSFTKSVYAFTLVAALEKRFPGFKSQLISDLVPECQSPTWQGVTVEHALDMSSGVYDKAGFEVDEHSKEQQTGYFLQPSSKQRVQFMCNAWQKQQAAGQYSVYHTTETEIVAYSGAQFIRSHLGADKDVMNDFLAPIFRHMGLSEYALGVQRTADSFEPWGGYGMSMTLNDVLRFIHYLKHDALHDGLLDETMVKQVLSGAPHGLPANVANFHYDNGFWRYHVGKSTAMKACGENTQVPVMSGFGGHTAVILPEVTIVQLTDGGGLGFSRTITDVFNHISDQCPEG